MISDAEPKIRVVLADDHAVLRAGLKALLNAEPDIEVVGEAPDGASAVDAARDVQPDVIVMDIQMPRMSGLDATRAIRQSGLSSKVLILTMHAESQYLLPLLEAGGSGYVLKAGADTELIEAIRTVHRGEVFLYPAATKLLVDGYLDRSTRDDEPFDGLTEREREVLKLVAEGFSGTEIAEQADHQPQDRRHLSRADHAEAWFPPPLRAGALRAAQGHAQGRVARLTGAVGSTRWSCYGGFAWTRPIRAAHSLWAPQIWPRIGPGRTRSASRREAGDGCGNSPQD